MDRFARHETALSLERTPEQRRLHGIAVALAAGIALTCALFLAPSWALAHETGESPCTPTAEQKAAYLADGSFENRLAFEQALENDQPNDALVQQALARQNAQDGIAQRSVPSVWASGMATQGKAHVLALHVTFPDYSFEAGDTAQALQALIGPTSEGAAANPGAASFPYESLSAYYYRASYGKLSLTGETFEYRAQHPRDYYSTNITALFEEALKSFDDSVDLTRFDANEDGKIDAVYLRFAGKDTGWGSVWWSNESTAFGSTETYENGRVRLWNTVTLAEPSNDAHAAQTLIHETGHVLGLPDYYQYAAQQGSTDARTGLLTFDMMMDNQGDHNGFSKWLLGWIADEDVTRVIANEQGITVKQGQTVVEQAPSNATVEQALEPFTSNDPTKAGRIAVVSNQDEGMFSSYYVLEYDQFAGNQSVYYGSSSEGKMPLPSGFRLFRVQGELTANGENYAHTNSHGTVYNQLIELVDPDMNEIHTNGGGGLVSSAVNGTGYGCMLYEGDTVSPRSFPSTNFFENVNLGFTGLTITATETGGGAGKFSVSYSSEDKPAAPSDFTLTPAFSTVSNANNLVFEASSAPSFPLGPTPQPTLIVDGEHAPLYDIKIDGTKITVPFFVNPADLKPTSTCEIVFPAGTFVIARENDEDVLSPEVRIPLEVDAHMATISQSGQYFETEYHDSQTAASDLFSASDGSQKFFQVADGKLKLHTIDPQSPGHLQTVVVEGADMPAGEVVKTLTAVPLSNQRAFLATPNDETKSCEGYWIDLERGAVEATCSLGSESHPRIISADESVIMLSAYPGHTPQGWRAGNLLTKLTLQADKTTDARYGWTSFDVTALAGSDAIACGTIDNETGALKEVGIVAGTDLARKLANSTYSPENASDGGNACTSDVMSATLPLAVGRSLLDVQRANGDYYVLLSVPYDPQAEGEDGLLVRFDDKGVEIARADISMDAATGDAFSHMRVGKNGGIALLARGPLPAQGAIRGTVQFLDATMNRTASLSTAPVCTGAWLADGRWLDIGHDLMALFGPKGSPAGANEGGRENTWPGDFLFYNITTPLDVEPQKPDDPLTPPVAPTDPTKDHAAKPEDPKALVPTGDAATTATLAAGALAMLAGGAAAAARRQRRSDRSGSARYL
ncbi:peptidase M6 [Paraeggerthella sp. Marseille-Q4926]|uniref:peptidase M6 n=1 Tax=Paraeggerthella sp. Marseille-Q4926 TaxID=2866587 RepID=UPI001CE3F109|nr:peptidase M6 [Paraeggerthella sp. Marseille-Q4926]